MRWAGHVAFPGVRRRARRVSVEDPGVDGRKIVK